MKKILEIQFVAPHLAPGIKKVPEYQRLKLKLAVRTGLEPATPCVTGMYSNQLNYRTFLNWWHKIRHFLLSNNTFVENLLK